MWEAVLCVKHKFFKPCDIITDLFPTRHILQLNDAFFYFAAANVWLLRLGPDGCLQNDGCKGDIILNLKNPKFKIQQIHTFPNPTKDRIFANLNCRHDFEVHAMDQLGHTVILDYSCDGNFISVNTKQLTPGIYTVLFSYIKRNERYYA